MRNEQAMLSPYRVLDRTDERGHLAGRLLADLGADVIKVEPPEGDPTRDRGPFDDDVPGPEGSLRWLAWKTNKRSVALDLHDEGERERILRLAQSADFLLESFAPGHTERLGYGYESLAKINSELILVSIWRFGQTGPHRNYRATDIVTWAMSGYVAIAAEASLPPAQISDNGPSLLHASRDAVIGALIASVRWQPLP